jgi:hypothetical protein
MEILIKIASCDWIAWAKLALVDPAFCKWAADPVQIARFMRGFIIAERSISYGYYVYSYKLAHLRNEASWFGYVMQYSGHSNYYDARTSEIIIYSGGIRKFMNTIGPKVVGKYMNNLYENVDAGHPRSYSSRCIAYKSSESVNRIRDTGERVMKDAGGANIHINPNAPM